MVSSDVWRRLDSLDIKYHEANYIKTLNDLMSVSYSLTKKTVRKSITRYSNITPPLPRVSGHFKQYLHITVPYDKQRLTRAMPALPELQSSKHIKNTFSVSSVMDTLLRSVQLASSTF